MALLLEQLHNPEVPLEAESISPDMVCGRSIADVEKLPLMYGNRKVCLAEFFRISGDCDDEIRLQGDHLQRVKFIGAQMTRGKISIDGDAGEHLGAAMAGGEITVNGNAADWVGPEMSAGRIVIRGDAGHMVGSAYRGAAAGMTGGEILIFGSARNETGNAMRNGLIAIGGNCGDFTGVNMLAGSIFMLGEAGIRTGAGMKRGSVVSLQNAEILPTFTYSCTYRPSYVRLFMNYLQNLGMPVSDAHRDGHYARYCGDGVELNKGEILVYTG